MKITRLNNKRDIEVETTRININIGGMEYEIEERHGEMEIRACDGALIIMPGVSNVIYLGTRE